jgi:hypothetical protein
MRLLQFLYNWLRLLKTAFAQAHKLRPGAVLCLEGLEARVTPTTFTWNGPQGDSLWSNPKNWLGGDGTNYPSTAQDTAIFYGADNAGCTYQGDASGNALTIKTLTLTGYTGTLTLKNKSLTINGGSMDNGTILGPPVPGSMPDTSSTLKLEVASGTFTWTGGNINYAKGAQTLLALFQVGDNWSAQLQNNLTTYTFFQSNAPGVLTPSGMSLDRGNVTVGHAPRAGAPESQSAVDAIFADIKQGQKSGVLGHTGARPRTQRVSILDTDDFHSAF